MTQWIKITDKNDLAKILDKSESKPQIIFKDSTTCGISAYAKERLMSGQDLWNDMADFNYLDLLNFRDISNQIAQELNVMHQSPQIIILINREVVYKESHHQIQADSLVKILNSHS